MSLKINFLKAGKGDSIWISFKDETRATRNIIIDGGVAATYFDQRQNKIGELFTTINGIREREERIDLLVLSHIDNDHIEGFLKWFEIDQDAHKLIDRVWFNSGKAIAGYYNMEINKDLDIHISDRSNTNTGVPDALDFEDYLLKNNIWNKELIQQGNSLEFGGARLQVLSPTPSQLKNLLIEYRTQTGDEIYTASKGTDWKEDLKTLIATEKEKTFRFKQDSSSKNGSSISILLTFEGCNYLFLADSHPKPVCEAIRELGFSHDNPLKASLLQISHHGSKSNVNRDLLQLVATSHYTISTDSTANGHPHKMLLGRIIDLNPEAILYFNYDSVREKVFTPVDYRDFNSFKTRLTEEYTTVS